MQEPVGIIIMGDTFVGPRVENKGFEKIVVG
jgi:hypothetical protein